MFEAKIHDVAPLRLVGLAHQGPYMEIGRTFGELWQLLVTRQLLRPGMLAAAAYYDDPAVTPAEKLRSFAAVMAPPELAAEAPLSERTLAGGPHAVLIFKGHYSGLHAAYTWLYQTWLPASGRTLSGQPSYEVYLNDPSSTPPDELLTEIRQPLAAS